MATNWKIRDRIKDRWEIHKILKGGMGDVYVVYDHQFREAFAIKTFQDEVFEQDPTIADRFRQEAITWVKLDAHENVTRARFVETFEGKPFLFLEYVSGGDLGNWIGTPRLTDDLPQVLRFAVHFCDGMIHALSHGIKAHRDIKPANCLITQDKKLQVTDFGLARVFEEGPQEPVANLVAAGEPTPERGGQLSRLFGKGLVSSPPGPAAESSNQRVEIRVATRAVTQTGIGAGTPHYMAPEQFDDFKRVDMRGDIYSFGVMLFEMVTGRRPFVGRSWEEYKHLHQTQPPPLLSSQGAVLNEIVQGCLAKDPARRFAEFRVVRQQLAAIYERLTGQPAPRPATAAELGAREWINKGISLVYLGRPDDALACFDRTLKIDPREALAWYCKGIVLAELGRPEDALACYDRALDIDPRLADAWHNKGIVLAGLGRHEDAVACYDRALKIEPRDGMAWHRKGVALGILSRPEEALACFDRALEIDSRDAPAWCSRGVLLANLGCQDDAVGCYDRALEIDPSDAKNWFNKGVALAALGRFEAALACAESAHRLGHPRAGETIDFIRMKLRS